MGCLIGRTACGPNNITSAKSIVHTNTNLPKLEKHPLLFSFGENNWWPVCFLLLSIICKTAQSVLITVGFLLLFCEWYMLLHFFSPFKYALFTDYSFTNNTRKEGRGVVQEDHLLVHYTVELGASQISWPVAMTHL